MRHIFIFLSLLVGQIAYSAPSQKASEEIQQIDAELDELRDMKRGFDARALRHDEMASYMQFEQQNVLETRRHLQLAEENRQKSAKVQERIDMLEAKKQKLMKG